MLIDWFTVIAQAVNFLILVWLLKRFLYAPILSAIAAREKHIADELADADAKKAGAQAERTEFRRKNDEFDAQRTALLNQATTDAMAERARLLDAARSESETLRTRGQEMLTAEYQKLTAEIAGQTRAQVFSIARKTLTDLANTNLEAHMTEVFMQRLRNLPRDEKPAAARLCSAFDLPPELRAAIEGAIKEIFPEASPIRFEVEPDLVGGIELSLQGQKIAWSIAAYLDTLEKDVNALIKAGQSKHD
jgi:F-type H+-transporting ATPase subunit b